MSSPRRCDSAEVACNDEDDDELEVEEETGNEDSPFVNDDDEEAEIEIIEPEETGAVSKKSQSSTTFVTTSVDHVRDKFWEENNIN